MENVVKLGFRVFTAVLNGFFSLFTGRESRQVFFDIDSTYPSLRALDQSWEAIRQEFEAVSDSYNLAEYHDIDKHQYPISGSVDTDKKWKIFVLNAAGQNPEIALRSCPETCRLLSGIPNLVQAIFSILEPGKSVPAHQGAYWGVLRYHLTLTSPSEDPPCLRVKDQKHFWEPGNSILFDDTWDHEVINHARQERAILIVDVARPMPLLPSAINKFLLRFLMKPTYGRMVLNNQRLVMEVERVEREASSVKRET